MLRGEVEEELRQMQRMVLASVLDGHAPSVPEVVSWDSLQEGDQSLLGVGQSTRVIDVPRSYREAHSLPLGSSCPKQDS
jgi:hypothetical protein